MRGRNGTFRECFSPRGPRSGKYQGTIASPLWRPGVSTHIFPTARRSCGDHHRTSLMIRCLIVDDEEIARRHLARLLTAYTDLEIAGEATNGLEALQSISDFQPDVVFLDVAVLQTTAVGLMQELS